LATPPFIHFVERQIINRERFFDKKNVTKPQKVSAC